MARYINYDDLIKKWHDLGFDEISRIHKINTEKGERTMTCKDCIHYDLCFDNGTLFIHFTTTGRKTENVETNCPFKNFKNKADYAEVKHGEWVIDNSIEERTFYDTNYKILITCNICGNRHFLGTQSYRNFTQEDLKEDAYRKYRYCGECGAKMDGNNLSTIPTGSEGSDI